MGWSLEELEVRMTHREYVIQRLHDKITGEERQEAEMDRKLIADNTRLAQRLRAG